MMTLTELQLLLTQCLNTTGKVKNKVNIKYSMP